MKTHKCILDFGFLNALSEFEIKFQNVDNNDTHIQRPYFVKNFVSISGILFRNIICCITQKDMVLCKAGHEFLFFYFHKLVFYLQQRSYLFKLTQTCNVCKKTNPHKLY